MNRTNIDYGIDLGTTNSAIARSENGTIKIIKSDGVQKDTTPSCVAINRSGTIIVGDEAKNELNRARNKKNQNPKAVTSDAFSEFKRMMGTDQSMNSVHLDRNLTPEDLSAEVLKKLKSYVKDDDSILSAVITVPAKFTNPQIDATQRAAKLAGFSYCELLQEPIAASIAYGLSGKNIDGRWVVFDFGGGTFDSALMEVEEGVIQVIDTEGDNQLGGKNLDDSIIDKILIPELKQKFALEQKLGDTTLKSLLRDALKEVAENIKIAFSNKGVEVHNCFEDDLGEDDNGEEIMLDANISFISYEKAVSPWFDKAIQITKGLLSRNNCSPQDLEKIVLVGGPTLSHLLRRMLEEEFEGLEIDIEIDPMTAVAVGAGLFASTKKLPSTLKPKDLAKAQLNLECADTSVESEEHVAVKLLRDETQGELPETIFIEINNADGTWKTGRSELEDDADVIMLTLSEGKQNVFNISLFDETGNRIASEPQQFSILQGMKIANPPLAYGVGIAIRGNRGKVIALIEGLERNVTLPAEGQIALKTVEDKNPNNGDSLIFELYQGEHGDEGVSVETLEIISKVEVDSDELPGFIAKGTEVEITIKVDESSRYSGEAYLTNLDESLDFDCPVVHLQTPSFKDLEQSISKAKAKLTMSEELPDSDSESTLNELRVLQEELNESGEEEDTRERIKKSLQNKWKEIDRMEDQAEWPSIEKELDDAIDHLKELEKEYGNDDSLSKTFETQIQAVAERKDVKIAKNLVREIRGASFSYLNQQPGFWVAMIEASETRFDQTEWKNSTQARQAIDDARSAVRTDPSVENLREKYFVIRDLMIDPTKGPVVPGGGDWET